MKNIGMETQLHQLHITKEDISIIINEGFTSNRMENNPRRVTEHDLQILLEGIL